MISSGMKSSNQLLTKTFKSCQLQLAIIAMQDSIGNKSINKFIVHQYSYSYSIRSYNYSRFKLITIIISSAYIK